MRSITDRWNHAGSRYARISADVTDTLQEDFFAGRDLGQSFEHIDADRAAVIVAETLEADRIFNLPLEKLLDGGFDKTRASDFKRAVLAEIAFSVCKVAEEMDDREQAGMWWGIGMGSLEEALRSPTASPLLWYEEIYFDLAQASRGRGEDQQAEAIMWTKRGLAHNLHLEDGLDALDQLRDLAQLCLAAGELDRGLSMLATLLRQDPDDIWTYNSMAIHFNVYGLTELGAEAARRGLALVESQGEPDNLREQLAEALDRMKTSRRRGRESEVSNSVLADLRAALQLDFDEGSDRPVDALCHELVPDLDEIPVKRPMTPSDLPLPDRYQILKQLTEAAEDRLSTQKPGRNDPCWCGSGKKYKFCHLREDQQQERG